MRPRFRGASRMAISGTSGGVGGGLFADINITPLTDIFLVLLIIFMVTTSVTIESAAHIDLPKAESTSPETKGVIVTYTTQHEIFVNSKDVPERELESTLREALGKVEDKIVVFQGDQKVLLGDMVRILDIAKRAGALVATNGGFFAASGDPLGCLMIAGNLISEPDPQRSCAGITADGTVLFDRLHADVTAVAGETSGRIDGVNRERRDDELILYRPIYDTTTRTNNAGAEAVIQNGAVVSVADLRGNAAIPRDGFVLSGHGRGRQWILRALAPGTPVWVQTVFVPRSGNPQWQQVVHAVGGGPRLLSGGVWLPPENFTPEFTDRRHPRSAIGVLADGRIVLVVVDGRQPAHSLGMTLPELAMALRRLGAVEAMNLDGGGSSALVVNGRVVTQPSDETGERPVSDALLVLPALLRPAQGP